MGYAINQAGGYRMVEPDWDLQPGETYSETLPEPSAEQVEAELLAEMTRLVQRYIDDVAKTRDYTDGLHAASYAVSTVQDWKAEGQAFVAWRDRVWLSAISIMDDCKADLRNIPSADELLDELPIMEWPNV